MFDEKLENLVTSFLEACSDLSAEMAEVRNAIQILANDQEKLSLGEQSPKLFELFGRLERQTKLTIRAKMKLESILNHVTF